MPKLKTNSIYKIDCFELLMAIEDKSADLVVLDPNYQDWDDLISMGLYEEALRVLKPTGNILLFTKKPYDFNLRNKINPTFRNEIIWQYKKNGNWYSNRMPIYTYQKIFWCCNKDFFYSQQTGIPRIGEEEQARNKAEVGGLFIGYKADECLYSAGHYIGGQFLKDLLDIPRKREGKIPSKPVELCQILIRCFSPIGGFVVDPFMGGGNVILTSSKENRNFIGGDIDEHCFKLVSEKLKTIINKN
jgi:DNA modification methylase